jgi:MarR family transcriptional regulator, organic hydroperoxide resistance regulator
MSNRRVQDNTTYLLTQTMKAHRDWAAAALDRLGIHVGQERVLAALWDEDGLTQSQIADQLAIELPTLTKMLERMERADLVTRRRDSADARVSRVSLTERGRDLRGPVQAAWEQLDAQAFVNFTAEERLLARRFFLQMRDNLTRD